MHLMLAAADPMDEVLPHHLFWLGPMSFTNQMLMVVIAGALMVLVFPALFSHASSKPPTGGRNFFESICEYLRIEVFRPALKEHTDRFVPFLWTLFFFILFANLLGQIPVADFIVVVRGMWHGVTGHGFRADEFHGWGTATGTPITTGALAICAFFAIHVSGVMQIAKSLITGTYGHHEAGHGDDANHMQHMRGDALAANVPGDFGALTNPSAHYGDDGSRAGDGHGPAAHPADVVPHMNPVGAVLSAVPLYLWNFAPHPFRPAPGTGPAKAAALWVADILMWAFLLALELLGAVIKPFSLTIRLFANMIAGHIVLGSLLLLIPLSLGFFHQLAVGAPITVLSIVIRVLELFVAFLQAYIFTFLTTLFIASAVAPEH